MRRREDDQLPDATTVVSVQELAAVLRQLRRREARQRGDSQLTYRELATKTGWSLSVISEYFAGTVLAPTDRFDVLVRLLGATEAEQRALATARDRVEERARPKRPNAQAAIGVTAGTAGTAATAGTAGTAVSPEPPPRQLPADVPMFTGRDAELAELDALLEKNRAVVAAVTGTAGVGKTALVVHWAHRVRDHFPDGQLHLDLRGFDPAGTPVSPAEAVRAFLDAFAVPPQRVPAGLDAQAALYRSLLADRRVLVVLDNARDAAQVRPLLPGGAGCLAVVTSRTSLFGLVAGGAHHLGLELPGTAEARELLARRLGAARVAAEPAAADAIVTGCARLPLAIVVVAARATARPRLPLAELAGELRGVRATRGRRGFGGGLDVLDTDDPVTDVRGVFSWSYRTLGPGAAAVFRLLGVHPGPELTVPAAASLAKLPVDTVRPLLTELVAANLVDESRPGRYRLHDLLRAYAAELAGPRSAGAAHRVLDHYLHTALAADRLVNPERMPITADPAADGVTVEAIIDREHAMAWFAAEHEVLLSAVDTAVAAGLNRHAWQLPWALADFCYLRGHHHHLAAIQRTALAAAGRLGDLAGEAHAHRVLSSANERLGRYDDARAHLGEAIERYGRLGDRTSEAHIRLNLGSVLTRQGRFDEALEHAEQALRHYRDADLPAWQARALDAIGWLHAQLGRHEQALAFSRQALTVHQAIGDRHGEAETWDSLGFAHHHLADHAEAVRCYQHAVALYTDLGDRFNQATSLANLGDALHASGAVDAARDAWRDALAELESLGHADAATVRAKLTGSPFGRRSPAE